jgi:DNA-binding MarR family transcriptional regulator
MKEEKVTAVLEFCRQPRTLHCIKDKFGFKNSQLKKWIGTLEFAGWISISTKEKDGRGTKQIKLTDQGKAELVMRGVRY